MVYWRSFSLRLSISRWFLCHILLILFSKVIKFFVVRYVSSRSVIFVCLVVLLRMSCKILVSFYHFVFYVGRRLDVIINKSVINNLLESNPVRRLVVVRMSVYCIFVGVIYIENDGIMVWWKERVGHRKDGRWVIFYLRLYR